MALFKRRTTYSKDYLQATDTVSRPMAIGSALLTGLLVAGAIFGIYLAGRWVYNRVNTTDSNTPSATVESDKNNSTNNGSDSSQNGTNGNSRSTDQQNSGSSTTNGSSGSSPTSITGQSGQSNTVPSTGATPETASPAIPNTGPDPNYNY